MKGQMRQLAAQLPDASKSGPGSLHEIGSRCSFMLQHALGQCGCLSLTDKDQPLRRYSRSTHLLLQQPTLFPNQLY